MPDPKDGEDQGGSGSQADPKTEKPVPGDDEPGTGQPADEPGAEK